MIKNFKFEQHANIKKVEFQYVLDRFTRGLIFYCSGFHHQHLNFEAACRTKGPLAWYAKKCSSKLRCCVWSSKVCLSCVWIMILKVYFIKWKVFPQIWEPPLISEIVHCTESVYQVICDFLNSKMVHPPRIIDQTIYTVILSWDD